MDNEELQLIRASELADLLGVNKKTLWRWDQNGDIPIERIRLTSRVSGYRKKEVSAWLNGKL